MVDSAKLAIFFQKRITIHTMSRDFCRFSHIFADLVTLGLSNLAFQASLLTLAAFIQAVADCPVLRLKAFLNVL